MPIARPPLWLLFTRDHLATSLDWAAVEVAEEDWLVTPLHSTSRTVNWLRRLWRCGQLHRRPQDHKQQQHQSFDCCREQNGSIFRVPALHRLQQRQRPRRRRQHTELATSSQLRGGEGPSLLPSLLPMCATMGAAAANGGEPLNKSDACRTQLQNKLLKRRYLLFLFNLLCRDRTR